MPTTDSAEPIMKKRTMNGASYAYVRIEGRDTTGGTNQ